MNIFLELLLILLIVDCVCLMIKVKKPKIAFFQTYYAVLFKILSDAIFLKTKHSPSSYGKEFALNGKPFFIKNGLKFFFNFNYF